MGAAGGIAGVRCSGCDEFGMTPGDVLHRAGCPVAAEEAKPVWLVSITSSPDELAAFSFCAFVAWCGGLDTSPVFRNLQLAWLDSDDDPVGIASW